METYVIAVERKIEQFFEIEAATPEEARKKFMMSDDFNELEHLKRSNGISRLHVLDEDAEDLLLEVAYPA